jgi:alpha-tubulin suppressor-like RCC1 family protein
VTKCAGVFRLVATMVVIAALALLALGSVGTGPAGAAQDNAPVYRWGVPLASGGGAAAGMEANSPTEVTGIPDPLVQLVTSNSDTYGLDSFGQVWAWGADDAEEFGNGSTTAFSNTPVRVRFPRGVRIASLPSPLPFNTGAAIDTSGNVWGWGANQSHELCVSGTSIPLPERLPVSQVTSASGAGGHMIYDSDGSVVGCGDNEDGELGTATNFGAETTVTAPTGVSGLPHERVASLVSSWQDSGALMEDGSFYDWGYNANGQLGDGSTANSPVPVLVKLRAPVVSASQGGSFAANGHTIVILKDNSVWSWGTDTSGQLGDGQTTDTTTPVQVTVPGGTVFHQVVAGGASSFAIDGSDGVWSWGQNTYGQLGIGTADNQVVTVPGRIGVSMSAVSSTAYNVAGI